MAKHTEASTTEEGEQLMWFFQKGFAFRLSERFQSMSEFTSELMRFADISSAVVLDPIEQFKILSHNVETTDRNVQMVALKSKYQGLLSPIYDKLGLKLKPITQHEGSFGIDNLGFTPGQTAQLPKGDLLETFAKAFSVSRRHFADTAVVAMVGIAEGMDIHLYACGYTTPLEAEKLMEWSKVAVVEDAQKKISDRTLEHFLFR